MKLPTVHFVLNILFSCAISNMYGAGRFKMVKSLSIESGSIVLLEKFSFDFFGYLTGLSHHSLG
ncbi:hypothetical protein ECANGB1_2626 [Enterospora canceri]|uniref:Uncharacterized protein n=1 Tax=Enterospora canceri TaxID=1081671 RepID=A0A1Y1SA84_9MICR|nr:hypothetical protein ECANGB1_2626 [Enterospora canceri]